ncbi:MAG TPA: tripartite tricarboxylate transporter permease, partial [Ramlibacter sp.]|nr:tripartite tricarboxylate transporter permease [Ramlibacter sp.]
MSWDFLVTQFGVQFGMWWVIVPAILLGIVVGALPGFSAQNSLIILLPLTLSMNIHAALAFMIALYCATHLGGGIPAILVRIPGTGGAAATTLDGYPMTRKGQAQQALVLSFCASVFGGLIATLATFALLPWLSKAGLYLRSVEMVVVMLFGLTLIAAVAAQDFLKGIIAGLFGLMIGMIGSDHIYNTPRATFGFLELYDGVPLVPALIGLFAISEALVMVETKMIVSREGRERAERMRWSDTVDGLRMSLHRWWHIVWTSFVGLVIGIIPGAGASVAAFVAYQQSRLWSKTPELYGTGIPEGVIAPESANNGVTSGTLVPMMA